MAVPFPDVRLRDLNVHSVREVERVEVQEEGEIATTDTFTVTASGEEDEATMIEVRWSIPSDWKNRGQFNAFTVNVIDVNVRVILGADTTNTPDGDPSNADTLFVTDPASPSFAAWTIVD